MVIVRLLSTILLILNLVLLVLMIHRSYLTARLLDRVRVLLDDVEKQKAVYRSLIDAWSE